VKPDEKRALSDYSCATRKLTALFRRHRLNTQAKGLEQSLVAARQTVEVIRKREAK